MQAYKTQNYNKFSLILTSYSSLFSSMSLTTSRARLTSATPSVKSFHRLSDPSACYFEVSFPAGPSSSKVKLK